MKRFVSGPASGPLRGTLQVPGDKSISHRALIFAALADGTSNISGLSDGEDVQRTLEAMRGLGATIERTGATISMTGVGIDGLRQPSTDIDCGNSGTAIRLLAGLLAGQSFPSRLTGDESLVKRPMNRVAVPLRAMGAQVSGAARNDDGETYPPLELAPAQHVQDGMSGIDYSSPIASAQVKSAILLAGLYASGKTTVTEPRRSRDHTERMLAGLGLPIRVDGLSVTLDPTGWNRSIAANSVAVPGDPSSAAFLIIAALIAGAAPVVIENICINPTRTGYLDVLKAMGAKLTIEQVQVSGGEPIGRISVETEPGGLRGSVVGGDLTVRAIDEIPVLAIAAACADGVTDIRDAAELRVKESDRIASTLAMLRVLGVEVKERRDGFTVNGRGRDRLEAGVVDAHGDHRIAMAAAIAALAAKGAVTVTDVANVATSFPSFVATMNQLGARISEE